MKTYNPQAKENLIALAEVFEKEVQDRQLIARDLCGRLAPQDKSRIRAVFLEAQILAFETIRDVEQLADIVGSQSQGILPSHEFQGVRTSFPAPDLAGWRRRLPDVPHEKSRTPLPFAANENRTISYHHLAPINRLSADEFQSRYPLMFKEKVDPAFVIVDEGDEGTNLCLKADVRGPQYGCPPHILTREYFCNAKDDIGDFATRFRSPHRWYISTDNQFSLYFDQESLTCLDGQGSGRMAFRAPSIETVSVKIGPQYTSKTAGLRDIFEYYRDEEKPAFTRGVPSHALRRDLIAVLADAARDELLTPDGTPKYREAHEMATKLGFLPKNGI